MPLSAVHGILLDQSNMPNSTQVHGYTPHHEGAFQHVVRNSAVYIVCHILFSEWSYLIANVLVEVLSVRRFKVTKHSCRDNSFSLASSDQSAHARTSVESTPGALVIGSRRHP